MWIGAYTSKRIRSFDLLRGNVSMYRRLPSLMTFWWTYTRFMKISIAGIDIYTMVSIFSVTMESVVFVFCNTHFTTNKSFTYRLVRWKSGEWCTAWHITLLAIITKYDFPISEWTLSYQTLLSCLWTKYHCWLVRGSLFIELGAREIWGKGEGETWALLW